MKKFLFLCGKNKIRSLTADMIFSSYPDLDVRSAGLDNDAEHVLTPEDVVWAEYIFVMDEAQKAKIMNKYKDLIKDQKVVSLDIPDTYKFMDPALIEILKKKVAGWL